VGADEIVSGGIVGRRRAALLIGGVVVVTGLVTATLWVIGPRGPGHTEVGSLDLSTAPSQALAVGTEGLIPNSVSLPTVGVTAPVEATPAQSAFSPTLGYPVASFGLPSAEAATAWWSAGPKPGSDGLAVIVDRAENGPGSSSFGGVSRIDNGDKIIVRSAKQETVTYVVSTVISGVRAADPVSLSQALGKLPTTQRMALVALGEHSGPAGSDLDVVVLGRLRGR